MRDDYFQVSKTLTLFVSKVSEIIETFIYTVAENVCNTILPLVFKSYPRS